MPRSPGSPVDTAFASIPAGQRLVSEARVVLSHLHRGRIDCLNTLAADDVWDELVLSAWVYGDEHQNRGIRGRKRAPRRLGRSMAVTTAAEKGSKEQC